MEKTIVTPPPIRVRSETGRLKTVLLHRPGAELENLMPEYLTRQLFEDIPYLVHAREEHDRFAETLRACGVTVLYLTDLVAEAVADAGVRRQFVEAYLREAGPAARDRGGAVRDYLLSQPVLDMIAVMIRGVRKAELAPREKTQLSDYVSSAYPFLIDPMPNLYFTRDPFFNVANGVCISRMANLVRHRETLFGEYVFRFHPRYRGTPRYHARTADYSIEGGDVLVLNAETVAVGLSQRTDPQAAEALAKALIGPETGIMRVLAVDIPKARAYMHLDTVMTMVDRDKFTIHPAILPSIRSFLLEKRDGALRVTEQDGPFDAVLARVLGLPKVDLIACGGGSAIDAAREQWNDGTNTLAVAPGEVIAFSRNYVTNRILREHGVAVHEIPSAELSRGRGGPRCMSMPFDRED